MTSLSHKTVLGTTLLTFLADLRLDHVFMYSLDKDQQVVVLTNSSLFSLFLGFQCELVFSTCQFLVYVRPVPAHIVCEQSFTRSLTKLLTACGSFSVLAHNAIDICRAQLAATFS